MKTAPKPGGNMFQGMKVSGAPAGTPTSNVVKPAFGKFGASAASSEQNQPKNQQTQETTKPASGPMFNKFSQPQEPSGSSQTGPLFGGPHPAQQEPAFSKFGGGVGASLQPQTSVPGGFSKFGGSGMNFLGGINETGLNLISGNVDLGSASLNYPSHDDSQEEVSKSEILYSRNDHTMDEEINSTTISETPQNYSRGGFFGAQANPQVSFGKKFGMTSELRKEEYEEEDHSALGTNEKENQKSEDEENEVRRFVPMTEAKKEESSPTKPIKKPLFEVKKTSPVSIKDKIFSKTFVRTFR